MLITQIKVTYRLRLANRETNFGKFNTLCRVIPIRARAWSHRRTALSRLVSFRLSPKLPRAMAHRSGLVAYYRPSPRWLKRILFWRPRAFGIKVSTSSCIQKICSRTLYPYVSFQAQETKIDYLRGRVCAYTFEPCCRTIGLKWNDSRITPGAICANSGVGRAIISVRGKIASKTGA